MTDHHEAKKSEARQMAECWSGPCHTPAVVLLLWLQSLISQPVVFSSKWPGELQGRRPSRTQGIFVVP